MKTRIWNHRNIKNIDKILEPVSDMCDEHKRNEIRKAKLLGEGDKFYQEAISRMPAAEREKYLNQKEELDRAVRPRYVRPQDVRVVGDDAGANQVLKNIRNNPSSMRTIHPRSEQYIRDAKEIGEKNAYLKEEWRKQNK